jgi:hypothetical protein
MSGKLHASLQFGCPRSNWRRHPAWPDTRAAGSLIRKAAVQRFPYVIAFEVHERHLLVLAIAHSKRRPLCWLTRAEP